MNVTKTATTKTSPQHKTRIDISKDSRVELCKLLNQHLVDMRDLYSQAKQAHWNVKGIHFLQVHELFDKVALDLFPHIDTIAERVTTLGGVANGTSRMTAAMSRLNEFPGGSGTSEEFLPELADRYATLARLTRDGISKCEELEDPNSADLLTAVGNQLDESLWFIEAHLQGSKPA